MTKSPPPSISGMAKPPPGVNTGNTVLCAVSLASRVVVMPTPSRMALRRFGRQQRLAAQHAVLVGEGEAHDFELMLLDGALDLGGGLFLRGGPQAVARYEAWALPRLGFARGHRVNHKLSCPAKAGHPVIVGYSVDVTPCNNRTCGDYWIVRRSLSSGRALRGPVGGR